MTLFHRKSLAGIGVAAAAIASTALFSSPAQAASTGAAKVTGSATVQFNAASGKANGLVLTISGRTVTLNDKVAIKAGPGCKAVKGDSTQVKCTTSKKTVELNVTLGDKNDTVSNKTSVYMLVSGGSGNDTLVGGPGKDQLQGSSGNDRLSGNGGDDEIFGGAGIDNITGAAGDDSITGESGNDKISGGAGDDDLNGDTGDDSITADAGDDAIVGGTGADKINAGTGDDYAFGEAGNDIVAGAEGDDFLYGEFLDLETGEPTGSDSALDVTNGGPDVTGDICIVMAAGRTTNCEFVNPANAAAAAASARVAAGVVARPASSPLGK